MGKKKTKEQFVNEANLKHGNKYDYSKFRYENAHYKSIIICPEHGEFWQTPHEHVHGGQGCPICGKEKVVKLHTSTKEEFIEKAKKIHGDKYDYSKVEYINNHTKVCIICPEHGEFWQIPNAHLLNHGCPDCGVDRIRLTYDTFVEKANEKHYNKYQYPEFKYKNNLQYITIICPEHGEFSQKIRTHLSGCGCPECRKSTLENNVKQYLDNKKIKYIQQKEFEWLRYKYPLKIDFYLPDYKIGIECQGQQHYKPIKYFGGEETLSIIKERDKIKKELCENNGIKIVYYSDKKNTCKCKKEGVYLDLEILFKENLSFNPDP